MLKSLLQFGEGLQFLFIIISVASAKLCSALLVSFSPYCVIHIMHILRVTSQTRCSYVYFMSDTFPQSKHLAADWKCFHQQKPDKLKYVVFCQSFCTVLEINTGTRQKQLNT